MIMSRNVYYLLSKQSVANLNNSDGLPKIDEGALLTATQQTHGNLNSWRKRQLPKKKSFQMIKFPNKFQKCTMIIISQICTRYVLRIERIYGRQRDCEKYGDVEFQPCQLIASPIMYNTQNDFQNKICNVFAPIKLINQ